MSSEAQARRRLLIGGALAIAAVLVVAIVIALTSGSSSPSDGSASASAGSSSGAGLKGVQQVRAEFAGIPQKGNRLGAPGAPATLMVFADLQCPFCADFENKALPVLVKRYVRPGKLQVVFQPIVIIGNDSILGARASASAAQQNRMFDFNATVYRNQGQENSGYMNTAYVKRVAASVPGLKPAQFVTQLKGPRTNALLNNAQNLATSGHVSGTPSFFVARKGGTLQQIQVSSLTPSAFYGELDKLTG